MRYHIRCHFVEEQRKGFAVHHEMEKDVDDAVELSQLLTSFTNTYNPTYCYGLTIGISEEPTLVE